MATQQTTPRNKLKIGGTLETTGVKTDSDIVQCVNMLVNVNVYIQLFSLNACGLVSKPQYSEFVKLISEYSIICLQETKTMFICLGTLMHWFHRQNLSRYRSGWTALFYRQNLSRYIFIDHSSKSYLVKFLFTLSKTLCCGEEDLKCGIVYVPPVGSKYSKYLNNDPLFMRYKMNYHFVQTVNMLCF